LLKINSLLLKQIVLVQFKIWIALKSWGLGLFTLITSAFAIKGVPISLPKEFLREIPSDLSMMIWQNVHPSVHLPGVWTVNTLAVPSPDPVTKKLPSLQ